MLVARRLREGADEVRSLPQAVNKCAPTPADVAARAEVGVGWRVWEARSKNESRCIDRSHVIHLFNSHRMWAIASPVCGVTFSSNCDI